MVKPVSMNFRVITSVSLNSNKIFEVRHEKTGFLDMRKQRRRSALREADQRLCFCYMDIVQSFYFPSLKFQVSSHLL